MQRGGAAATDRSGPVFRHAFLQALMQRGCMPESEAKDLYIRIAAASTDDGYLGFVSDINAKLAFAQFELRRVKYPGDGAEYIGFVNRAGDEESRRSGKYRNKEDKPDVRITAFFRAVLEKIAGHEGAVNGLGWITSGDALNVALAPAATQPENGAGPSVQADEVPRLSKAERESALAGLTVDEWLALTPGRPGCYSLGVRSFLELGHLLLEMDLPPATRTALEAVLG